MHRPALFIALALFASLSGTASGGGSAAPASPTHRPFVARPGELEFTGMLIVRPAPGLPADRDARARERLAGLVLRFHPEVDEYVVSVPGAAADSLPGGAPGASENRFAAELLATGDYQYAHPNWRCFPVAIPNDPLFSSQWHHANMHSAEAWDLVKGSDSVVCAFVDTGINTAQSDLFHRVSGYNSASHISEADGGTSVVEDLNGHGTHVAGCGAAKGNNSYGVVGAGWDMRPMMIRTSDSSSGGAYIEDIMEGARWAIEHGARVASASYSGVEYDTVGSTGTYIKGLGGLFCYAAGNSASDLSWFDYADTIVVGATDPGDARAWFSSYGKAVDVFAPGQDILSTGWGGEFWVLSGTSMATPMANGVIGMIWSANPSLSAQQVEDILEQSCDDMGSPGEDIVYGWGRVNTFKAVKMALESSCRPDCNGDSKLDIGDFICMQDKFTKRASYGDYNGDGAWNIHDFVSFQSSWRAGCK